jgi:prevent-host-death family protein
MVNVHAAKTHFSELLARVERGEEIVVGRAGTPVAKIVKYQPEKRALGACAGQIWIADDFDELPEDTAAAFRGEHS